MLSREFLLSLLLLITSRIHADTSQVLDPNLYHLGTSGDPEWREFVGKTPHGPEFTLEFSAKANRIEHTLFLRQDLVKLDWPVELNGRKIGQLLNMEEPLIHALPIPPGVLRDGMNTLRIVSPGKRDDIHVGNFQLDPQPLAAAIGQAQLEIEVTDTDSGTALPSRITIVDSTGALIPLVAGIPSPPPTPVTGIGSGLGSTPPLALRPGVIYTPNGKAQVRLRPGEYTLYATRGFEYGLDQQQISIAAGESARGRLRIRREVDTSGWISSDTHTHTFTHSRHGDATIEERVITLAGEGIELPIAADHNYLTDYSQAAEQMGVQSYFTPVIGNEVTTRKGHFNVFPVEPGSRVPDFRIEHWPALMESIRNTPGVQVVILNHPRDLHSNFRPFGEENLNRVTGENRHGFEFTFDAVELVNSSALQSDLMQVFDDWFALLNHGYRVAGVASSDGHDVSRYIVGQGRTYVKSDATDPGKIDIDKACRSFLNGELLVSMGLLTLMTVEDQFGPGELATGLDEEFTVSIQVLGPSWTRAARVELYANGQKIRAQEIPSSTGNSAGEKARITWKLSRPSHDVHLVAIATGPGVRAPYWPIARPYQATSLDWNPLVISATNPIWIDADQDGQFTSPREYARALLAKHQEKPAELFQALARFDQAVAAQTAGLWAQSGAGLQSAQLLKYLANAPEQVRHGFEAFATSHR
jgi:hypothetical protein